jgi:phospholipid transport system substrate-binding protein
MNHLLLQRFFSVMAAGLLALTGLTAFAQEGPDQLIRRLSAEMLDTIKTDKEVQSGDVRKIVALVDGKVMPHVNFTRMTASAVGRAWRQATPEQQKRLQDEFKTLLVRTYAGALSQVKDQSVAVKPLRGNPADAEVIVRTEAVTRSSWTTGWRKPPTAGAFTTSMCWAFGW